VCSANSVSSYPAIRLWPGAHQFKGRNAADDVLAWVREQATPEQLEPLPEPVHEVHEATHGASHGHEAVEEATAASRNASSNFKARVTSALQQAALQQAAAAASATRQSGGSHASALAASIGEDLMRTAADLGISPQEEPTPPPMLRPRTVPRPVPVRDVLTAARFSLHHDVANALSGSPKEAYARKKLGALRGWLHALHRALPQARASPSPHHPPPAPPLHHRTACPPHRCPPLHRLSTVCVAERGCAPLTHRRSVMEEQRQWGQVSCLPHASPSFTPIPPHPTPSHPISSHPIPPHPIPSHPIPSHPTWQASC
jgi:hypothetical protein